jgi:hypothetical protein
MGKDEETATVKIESSPGILRIPGQMLYRVENGKLVITGSFGAYGLNEQAMYRGVNQDTYGKRMWLDGEVETEWKNRGKPSELLWIVDFEAQLSAEWEAREDPEDFR